MALSNSYEQVIVGKSYVSIIFGVIQKIRSNASNLIIDDERFLSGSAWKDNIGELERKTLKVFGDIYHIPCLSNLHLYIKQRNTMVFLNEKMIELGSSPFSNIKELARKLPERFSGEFIEGLSEIDPEKFDQDIDGFFDFVVDQAMARGARSPELLFKADSLELESVFQRFLENVQNERTGANLFTKQLHYILQALFQTILSNILSEVEVRYLLSSILSPRYQVDVRGLEDELMFTYKSLGGDIKKTKIQRFEIYKNRMECLLLESFEGLIKTENIFLFGHFKNNFPFEYESGHTVYQSIVLSSPIDHKFASFFRDKRIIFSPSDRMGTDFPHWEVEIDEQSVMRATYVYANHEGSKPSLYFKRASEDLFLSLRAIFPGLNKTDWSSQIEFSEGRDVWLENVNNSLNPARLKIFSDMGSKCFYQGKPVKNLNYCGPLRSRFLGYFGYLLNILNRQ